eukprot:TRINITY_DN1368_c0_g2_i1.p1 TRINITY_DN1368_c0_g2~~TRINITY_DN1368_c0_g2_i1.p1  ORF type:complete len:344 (-),score=126.18 TRINITY_DN1368_c0_g2_i1:138-1091(-)
MSLDMLAEADVDLDTLLICDLGVDASKLGFVQVHGVGCEIITANSSQTLNVEEGNWLSRVLDTARRVHAVGVVRVYFCKIGESTWTYNGLYGGAAIVTESNLQNACAHFIRVVDLDGFNPNTSAFLQQEMYAGFTYKKLTPWFHAFEMSKGVAGLSWVSEQEAEEFYQAVQYCISKTAREIVEEEYDSRETAFRMVGSNQWSKTDGSISVKVARKYAQGGITDGLEVKWKKPTVSPELAALLNASGVSSESLPTESSEPKPEPVSGAMWKKNATPLTGLEDAAKSPAAAAPERGRERRGTISKLLGGGSDKKKDKKK